MSETLGHTSQAAACGDVTGRPRQVKEKIDLLPHLRSPGTRGRRTQGSHPGMLGVCIRLPCSCPQTPKATGLHVDHVQSLGRHLSPPPGKTEASDALQRQDV